MTAARRATPRAVPAKPDAPRAKALRTPVSRRPAGKIAKDTRAALVAFEAAARGFETTRSSSRAGTRARQEKGQDASFDAHGLRSAAARVLDALCREVAETSGTLSPSLVADIDRWREGEFAGTNVDIEVANHAIYELLDSRVRAELDLDS